MDHDPRQYEGPTPPPVSAAAQALQSRRGHPASSAAATAFDGEDSLAPPPIGQASAPTCPEPPAPRDVVPVVGEPDLDLAPSRCWEPPASDLVTLRATDDGLADPLVTKQEGLSVFSSAVLHGMLFVMLALWIFPPEVKPKQLVVSAAYGETIEIDDEDPLVELESFEAPKLTEDVLPEAILEESTIAEELPVIEELDLGLMGGGDQPPSNSPTASDTSEPAVTAAPPSEALAGSGTVEGAVDRVTNRIRGKLAEGNVLVVWLLDSSHSLVDDRKRVAERLTPFYEELAAGRDNKHQLNNAVVAFGAKVNERIPPTTFGPRVAKAVEKLPVDASGKEMVFTAIQECVLKYRKRRTDEHLMIVVWTDETGDDASKLEQTIELCRRNRATVAVVGPSSVLGADTGLHSYVDPKTKRTFQLPVLKGPDAASPERLAVDYWFTSRGPGRGNPSWYGGPQLKGMASGFSPYALTRLAIQTKGEYTIFDRPSDRGPFELTRMQKYLPKYESAAAYERDLATHPLRQAVMRAVRVTQADPVTTPTMILFAREPPRSQPNVIPRIYYPPAQFAVKLRTAKGGLIRQTRRLTETVDRALAHLNKPELESAFEKETPRWRAWHDLTKGRLLAVKVRLEEYRLTCDGLTAAGALNGSTNHLVFRSSLRLRSDSKHQQLAREAERLLMRCEQEHPDTPWAYLAERELEHGLGVAYDQMSLRLIRGRGGRGPGPAPNLPNF